MKILVIHNSYKVRGGEDSVFENEVALLRDGGHEVTELRVSNDSVRGFFSKIFVAVSTVFSIHGYIKTLKAIDKVRPDVVHVHNYFPILSPSVFYACKIKGVPVVHTLHNFRAICPTALLQFNGKVTERSLTEGPWWAVRKRVYRGSLVGTFLLSSMISFHKKVGTWTKCVDRFIALTDFNKQLYLNVGWPKDKVVVKPNFTTPVLKRKKARKPYALFVGRLSEEKGIPFLLSAFDDSNELKLKVIGAGPLEQLVKSKTSNNIEYLGELSRLQVAEKMMEASCLVITSLRYEPFGMVIIEAMSYGLPVLIPSEGSMEGIVPNDEAGLHYMAGNRGSFLACIRRLLDDNVMFEKLSTGAKKKYQEKYTAEVNLAMLESIYASVISTDRVKLSK
ncbi:glycosyltransferase family 4 protein [Reinekea thalattae]|uniref:Glycosyltransferase family 4 protein n=1 Tax=Reinekea thalattae TaxID=2593301 RepID=A0A5C8Z7S0_9GAMM|nr:glycosyltransferase family 4 protein [Reinekea thalattae]TXR53343.1 glycosyltransferase family 4 protein [Reinekea thalattae]